MDGKRSDFAFPRSDLADPSLEQLVEDLERNPARWRRANRNEMDGHATSGRQRKRCFGGLFAGFEPFSGVFGVTEGAMSPRRGVYVTPHKGPCHPAYGSMSPRMWVYVTPHKGLCHPAYGSLSPRIWGSVTPHMGLCHPAEGYLSPRRWVHVTPQMGLCQPSQWIVMEINDAQESGHAGVPRLAMWQKIVAIES